jgi:hypothetical protein
MEGEGQAGVGGSAPLARSIIFGPRRSFVALAHVAIETVRVADGKQPLFQEERRAAVVAVG